MNELALFAGGIMKIKRCSKCSCELPLSAFYQRTGARCLRNKTDRTAALLGYSVEALRTHLEAHFEPGMSWGNYGKRNEQWSIDHSRPISSFPMTTTLAEINALENLRPMWHRKNCAKKNKWECR